MQQKILFLTAAIICIQIFGCGPSARFSATNNQRTGSKNENHKNGNILYGEASYYADKFHGRKTANGEIFDMHKISAAHKTLPFDTMLEVTNLENNKSVIVRVNDRGPYKKGRILDLSYRAAQEVDMIKTGVARVKIRILKMGPK